MDQFLGFLQDEGYSPQEIRELVGPLVDEAESASPVAELQAADQASREDAIARVIKVAQQDRKRPGKQVVVPGGAIKAAPEQAKNVTAIRVDTEESHRAFKHVPQSSAVFAPDAGDDLPQNSDDVIDQIEQMARADLFGSRGPASEWSVPIGLAQDQPCVLCGGGSGPICGTCIGRRSAAIGFEGRGSAASIYHPEEEAVDTILGRGGDFYTLPRHADEIDSLVGQDGDDFYTFSRQADEIDSLVLVGQDGDDFYTFSRQADEIDSLVGQGLYTLPRHADEIDSLIGKGDFYRLAYQADEIDSSLVGQGGFYRLAHQADGIDSLIGDVSALAVPSQAEYRNIPLSFPAATFPPGSEKHVAAFKRGSNLHSAIRVTGWDGQSKILSAATSYPKHLGIVVGYAKRAGLSPSQTAAIAPRLACLLGASQVLSRLAAGTPAVLHAVHGRALPRIVGVMPKYRR